MNLQIDDYLLTKLTKLDGKKVGLFFEALSEATRSLYAPHPLNTEFANKICESYPDHSKARFIVNSKQYVVGYFLFDFDHYPNEYDRYKKHGIELDFSCDPVFAPCIADDFQGKGISNLVMPHLIDWGKSKKIRSFVLMGGTQEPNKRARAFYRKFGFQEYEEFYTQNNGVNNIDMRLVL